MQQFEENIEKKIIDSNNTGDFFKFVNKRLGRTHDIGVLKNQQGETITMIMKKLKYSTTISAQLAYLTTDVVHR